MASYTRYLIYTAFILFLITGCSGKGNPSAPDTVVDSGDQAVTPELTAGREVSDYDGSHFPLFHNLIYMDVTDPGNIEYEIVPLREGFFHLNILKFLEVSPCTDCFEIVGVEHLGNGFINVDFKITHPYDDPLYTIFDVRGIMMFNGSRAFPVSVVSISDWWFGDGELLNPDGFTSLYNTWLIGMPAPPIQEYFQGVYASEILPNAVVNGYIRHISDDPSNTRNALLTGDSVTRTYSLKYPANEFVFGYAVDASWAVPIETPVDDPMTDFGPNANSPEPWKIIVTLFSEGLTDEGGTTWLQIDVYDYGGKETHDAPVVEIPELFDGEKIAGYKSETDDFSRYHVALTNQNLAPGGYYKCLITVQDNDYNPNFPWIDMKAFQVTLVRVSGKPIAIAHADPIPQNLNQPVQFWGTDSFDMDGGEITFYEWDWDNDGTYDETGSEIYHAWDTSGLHFVQLRVTDDEGDSSELVDPLEIIIAGASGIMNPEIITPELLNINLVDYRIDWPYLYVLNDGVGLQIIDISSPSNPLIFKTFETDDHLKWMQLDELYLYVSTNKGLFVVDVSEPATAYVYYYLAYKAMGSYGSSGVAIVKDGYLYKASSGISIIDIDPLDQAHWVASEPMAYYYDWFYGKEYYTTATAIGVSDSIAFVWALFEFDGGVDLYRFNIDPPENLSTIDWNSFSDVGYRSVKAQNGYVYYTAQQNLIVSTDGLGSINFVPGVPENGTIWLDDDILGVYGKAGDVMLLNIENNEYPSIISTIEGPVYSATSNDGYAVLEYLNFQTWDIDPPETPNMLGEFKWIHRTGSLCRSGDYLYVSVKRVHHGDFSGLLIIDISKPEQPVIVKLVPTEYHITDLEFENGYLFCSAYNSYSGPGMMTILDVDPIEDAHVTDVLEIPEGVPMFINVHDGYAYLVTYNDEFLYIYDIESSAYLVSTTDLGLLYPWDIGVAFSDDYVYATDKNGRLIIISLDPPDNPQIIKTLEFDEKFTPFTLYSNGLLFLPQQGNGLKIVDVDPPEEAHLINEIYGTAIQCYSGNGEYIFIGDRDKGTQIIDVMPPENAHIFSTIDIYDYNSRPTSGRSLIVADDKYAYISGYYSGLQIVELY